MKIGVPKEIWPDESRAALVPDDVRRLTKQRVQVQVGKLASPRNLWGCSIALRNVCCVTSFASCSCLRMRRASEYTFAFVGAR
jgi:hypothetical protein